MERRNFLRGLAVTSAGLAISSGVSPMTKKAYAKNERRFW